MITWVKHALCCHFSCLCCLGTSQDLLGSDSPSTLPGALGRGQLWHCPNSVLHSVPSTCLLLRPALRTIDSGDVTKFRFCPPPTPYTHSLASASSSVPGDVSGPYWSLTGFPLCALRAQLSPPCSLFRLGGKQPSRDARGDIPARSVGICWQMGTRIEYKRPDARLAPEVPLDSE